MAKSFGLGLRQENLNEPMEEENASVKIEMGRKTDGMQPM